VQPAGLVHARRQSGERSSPDPGDSPDPDSAERDRSRICLAEGEPAEALGAVQPVLDGVAPVIGNVSVVEAQRPYRRIGELEFSAYGFDQK
jgi:hypothetical protein